MDSIDTHTIKALLLDGGTRGPDGVDRLIAAFDEMNAETRTVFAHDLGEAIQQLLADSELAQNSRDVAFDNAAHVVQHVLENPSDVVWVSVLQKPSLDWLDTKGRTTTPLFWFSYSCVLRLIRLTGYSDDTFWKNQFDFWVPQLIEQEDHFVEVCRSIMQCVRALGSQGNLNSTHLGSLFAIGLRAASFPVHEVYAALEEVTHMEGQPNEHAYQRLYEIIRRDVDDARSPDAAPQQIQSIAEDQLNKTLKSWRINKLKLQPLDTVQTTSQPSARRPLRLATYSRLQPA